MDIVAHPRPVRKPGSGCQCPELGVGERASVEPPRRKERQVFIVSAFFAVSCYPHPDRLTANCTCPAMLLAAALLFHVFDAEETEQYFVGGAL